LLSFGRRFAEAGALARAVPDADGRLRAVADCLLLSIAMNDDNAFPTSAQTFRAILLPHRSLGRKGFIVLMSVVSGISFLTGLAFFMLGAWPVLGFCGLDVLLIYGAFRLNYRAARLHELIELSENELKRLLTFGSFLSDDEKRGFAEALRAALRGLRGAQV
jgi:uncharacterized membrane protein